MSTRQPVASIADFLDALRASRLLDTRTLDEVARTWHPADNPRLRALDLVESRRLTHLQARLVLAGRQQQLRLGRYLLLERLGAGGMGHVFKAVHVLMNRVVALKIVARLPRDEQRAGIRTQFRREAEAAAALRHPHIVTSHDAGVSRGRLFLVMEHLAGIDLGRHVLRSGPLDEATAREILRQVGHALHFAHTRGLVHRDIKPTNIFLVENHGGPTLVKLLDLGLARHTSGREEVGQQVAGTPDFMSPEQAANPDQTDVRGDLYSLGCTIYYLLAGQPPFPGGTWTEKLLQHQYDAPTPLGELRPDVSPGFLDVIDRLMAKDPQQRPASPAALLHELEALTRGEEHQTARPPTSHGGASDFWHSELAAKAGKVLCAIGLGLVLACGLREVAMFREDAARRTAARQPARPVTRPMPYQVEGDSKTYGALADAIAAASSGGVIVVTGAGPHRLKAMSLRGKALTLRAGAGVRPCLEKIGTPGGLPWEGMLNAYQPLTLQGLELRLGSNAEGPLVVSEGASVRLLDCHYNGKGRAAAVAIRHAARLDVRNCRFDAELGLAIEVDGHTAVAIDGCQFISARPDSAAVALWSSELAMASAVELRCAETTFETSRVLAVHGLRGPARIRARDCTFRFAEALLAFTAGPPGSRWRDACDWHGTRNRFRATGAWVAVNGEPQDVEGLSAWQELWHSDPESRQDPNSPLTTRTAPGERTAALGR